MKSFYILISVLFFSVFGANAQYTLIPDAGFEANLIALGYDSGPIDGMVTTANISGVTNLFIDVLVIGDQNVNDFTGIEDFASLTNFRANFVSAPSIDLSNNMALVSVNVIGSQLTHVNIQNTTNTNLVTLNIISVANNSTLSPVKICVDDAAYAQANFGDIYAAGTYFVEDCSVSVNSIMGTTYFDADNNGCDISEIVTTNGTIVTAGANYSFGTPLYFENYTTYSLDQNVTTELQGLPPYFTVTPGTTTFNYGANTGSLDVVDYCITANAVVNDLQIEGYTVLPTKPGFTSPFRIFYENLGTTTLSGSVSLQYEDLKQDYYSDNADVTPTISGNTITWAFTNLAPFEEKYIDVNFTINTPTDPVNPVNGGDTLTYVTAITPAAGDLTPANNTHVFNAGVVNAYDPNDVTCFQGDTITLAQVPDDLTYRIRFQNTGSAAATNILVKNAIDSDLDISTFQFIGASDPVTITTTSPNEMKFTFLNINLPDSTNDEPNSHGWILYKMKPLSTSVIGDVFENTASIYFDYNAPIITNTATTTVGAPQTYVPDDNFENYLEANGMGNGIPLDDYVTTANINTVTALNVTSQNIADLTGIEDFTLLENLIATSNNLTTVDISQNAQLLTINFLFNSLTALDVSQNLLLTSIITHHNNLTSLDISNNLNLLGLDCRVNNIVSLDISNPLLAWVHTSDNGMTSLTTGANTALATLYCHNNALTNLDFSVNTNLSLLYANNNQLTSLNVKNGNNINFTEFQSQTNSNLLCIEVDDAAYSSTNWLNVDPVSSFSENCATFGLTYVPDNNFEAYLETHDANGALVSIGSSSSMGNGIINDDYVFTNRIDTVTDLDINTKSIADLTGIEDFTALQNLIAHTNLLTTVDISQNIQLLTINFLFNNLTTLDVSANTLLTNIITHQNNLTSLDVSNNLLLIGLDCRGNNITSLDISNPLLSWVHCSDNGMTTLTTGANTSLATLYCHNNAITDLDFSSNTSLSLLQVQNNQLTGLNVQNGNNTNFTQFQAQTNSSLTCIFVDDAAWSAVNWTSIDGTSNFVNNQAECDVLGTNDFEIVHIKLFPNPAKSTIQISGLNSIENYTLYNTIGVEVSKGVVQNSATINVQLLPSGIYFLKLESGNILKFVKE